MKKLNTYYKQTIIEVNGVLTRAWIKKCPICSKEYTTTSRTQKYCSSSCSKKAQVAKKVYHKAYDEDKIEIRLSSRSHSLAVAVIDYLIHRGTIPCQCQVCGASDQSKLEVHHKNSNWLDNRTENLELLCVDCHHKRHSEIEVRSLKDSLSI